MTKKEKNVDSLPYKKVSGWYRFWKRTFDIFVSGLAIIVLALPLLVIYIIVWATSKGTGIFHDNRVGKDHKPIHVYKFRTMYADAEENIDKYLSKKQQKEWKKERKVKDDPRITPFGAFLRKTSLDELPQLFNIFKGSMTVVGPRPITEKELQDHYTKEEQEILLSARPGLLGYWGVMGRNEVQYDKGRQKLELDYFKLRGLWFDLCLMFRAIPAVLKGKGAK
ncbi:MAG: sugar transferase [Bacilli bacterium]|nr:sugar transferase [Bacilli bacterium]